MRAALSTAGLVGLLLLTGCTSGGAAATSSAASSGPTGGSSTAPPAVPSSPPPAGASRAAVTGSRTVQGKEAASGLLVELRGLHRDGKLLRMDFSVTNTSAVRLFAPDVLSPMMPSDINLLDSDGLKKYLVVKDSAGQYAFTRPSLYLLPEAVFDGTAYFAAPPAGVSTMTVNFGELGAFPTSVT